MRGRLLAVAAALVATAPIWPVDPLADEAMDPAEVAVLVPVVLTFPVAWALLARSRRFGLWVALLLAGLTGAWSVWTVTWADFGTPPDADDGLRWYLGAAGAVVLAATPIDVLLRRRASAAAWVRWAAGALVWCCGVALVFAVPKLDGEPMPPDDALLPLPPTMVVLADEAGCASPGRSCVRRFTVTSAGHLPARELARRLGEHLAAKGWQVRTSGFAAEPRLECRRAGWLTNPFELCGELRVDEQRATVEIQFAHANRHDPIVE